VTFLTFQKKLFPDLNETTLLLLAEDTGGRAAGFLHRDLSHDWQQAAAAGEAGYLLSLNGDGALPDNVRRYLQQGESQGVHHAYKCRTRSPWYRVPHVYQPDAFLSYMSGETPRLVANDTEAVAPNSLHIVRLHAHARVTQDALAALWQTSLTSLSVEVEGHALGGRHAEDRANRGRERAAAISREDGRFLAFRPGSGA